MRYGADALYFAVLPALQAAETMVELGRDLRRRGGVSADPMAAARMHVSVANMGDGWGLSPRAVAEARAVGDAVSWPDFDLLFTRAATFGGRALVLRCSDGPAAALHGLRDHICDLVESLGLGRAQRSAFEPHLTFAWARATMPEVELDDVVRWPARELVLVHSEQGKGRHHHLGRWPLRSDRIKW